jgi:hypothetical protein
MIDELFSSFDAASFCVSFEMHSLTEFEAYLVWHVYIGLILPRFVYAQYPICPVLSRPLRKPRYHKCLQFPQEKQSTIMYNMQQRTAYMTKPCHLNPNPKYDIHHQMRKTPVKTHDATIFYETRL